MPRRIEIEVPDDVFHALQQEASRSGLPTSELIESLLKSAVPNNQHTLFQVSTSNALVQGVFGGSVTISELRKRGDFGLGTFADLDGEMVMLDGLCYRSTAGGETAEVDDDREVPFAMVTAFSADVGTELETADLNGLAVALSALRPSDNLFVALRVRGSFPSLELRAICRAEPGETLTQVAEHQSEYEAIDVDGTLVGFWSPEYAESVSIPGLHVHFISGDRQLGGHVMSFTGRDLELEVHVESDLHVALPESAEFLAADLAGDHTDELDAVERKRR